MPIYEYECLVCGTRFERRQSIHDEPIKECTECHGGARRVIQPVGIIFKGSGFYVTDSRKPESASGSSSTSSQSGNGSDSSSRDAGKDGSSAAKSEKTESKAESKPESKSEAKPEAKPEAKTSSGKSDN